MISQRSGKQGLKQHLSTLNPTSLKVFSWSVYECMKMSYIGTLVFCLQKWSCRLVPRAILACFDRWSLHIWPESTTQAFGHKWRNKLETHNQLLNLCKIIGVEAAVLFWFWLCFNNWFSQVFNFHPLSGKFKYCTLRLLSQKPIHKSSGLLCSISLCCS